MLALIALAGYHLHGLLRCARNDKAKKKAPGVSGKCLIQSKFVVERMRLYKSQLKPLISLRFSQGKEFLCSNSPVNYALPIRTFLGCEEKSGMAGLKPKVRLIWGTR